jgi:sugar phosphate isomerase/epimerase
MPQTQSPKFGVSEFTTNPQSFEDDAALYADLGVSYIEVVEDKLDTKRLEEQMALLKTKNLHVGSWQPSVRTLFPSQTQPEPKPIPERMARFRQTVERLAPYAPAAPFVTNTGIPPSGNVQQVFDTAVREYAALADFAAGHGARIALEPLNASIANIESAIWTVAQAMEIIEAVGRDNFGLCLDTWNIWQNADIEREIIRAGPRIFVVQVSDWRTPRSFQDRLIPGQGTIPLARLLHAVRETGFDGPYSVEIFSGTDLPDSLWKADPKQVILDSRAGLEAAWQESQVL